MPTVGWTTIGATTPTVTRIASRMPRFSAPPGCAPIIAGRMILLSPPQMMTIPNQ